MKPLKYIVNLCLACLVLPAVAQERMEKISQSINVNEGVTIDLNTSYTNLEIDTWNKDIIEIEAYIESDKLSEAALKDAIDAWQLDIDGSKSHVTINTAGSFGSWDGDAAFFDGAYRDKLRQLELQLANIPEPPLVEAFNLPEMPPLPEMPALPALPEGIETLKFDYDRYKKEGESYLDKWSEEYGEKFGEEYAERMEAWAEEMENSPDMKAFEKRMEAWGEQFGEQFGEQMEAWGERFEARMAQREKAIEKRHEAHEKRAQHREQFQEAREAQRQARMEARDHALEARKQAHFERSENQEVLRKTIRIKMPKKAKLQLNVRHGALKFVSTVKNTKAVLTHTALVANSIDGSQTSINVSYSPVEIQQWHAGELLLNFVDVAHLQVVDQLVLNANSSNVQLGKINNNAVISGSFGDLNIANISNDFNTINVVLENSDAQLKLPTTNYNLQYVGKHSKLEHPDNTAQNTLTNFSTGDFSSHKTIVVNAKFSEVVME